MLGLVCSATPLPGARGVFRGSLLGMRGKQDVWHQKRCGAPASDQHMRLTFAENRASHLQRRLTDGWSWDRSGVLRGLCNR